jgi:hypothetical protein
MTLAAVGRVCAMTQSNRPYPPRAGFSWRKDREGAFQLPGPAGPIRPTLPPTCQLERASGWADSAYSRAGRFVSRDAVAPNSPMISMPVGGNLPSSAEPRSLSGRCARASSRQITERARFFLITRALAPPGGVPKFEPGSFRPRLTTSHYTHGLTSRC